MIGNGQVDVDQPLSVAMIDALGERHANAAGDANWPRYSDT